MMSRRKLPPGDKTLSPLGIVPRFARDPVAFLKDQMQRYGDVVTMQGPFYRPNILINDPELTHQVLVTHADKFQKPPLLKRVFTSTFGNGLFFSEGEFWRRQRKLMQPAFHHQHIQRYGQGMVHHTLEMLSGWRDGHSYDLAKEMRTLTLIIVVDAIFQADVTEETTRFTQAITVVGEVLAQQFVNPVLALLPDSFPLPSLRRKRKAVAELDRIVYSLIAKHRGQAAGRHDLLSLLLMATDEDTGERMSDVQLHDEILTLFIAGHETTALTLIWAFILLHQHPDVEAKLHAELDSVLSGRPPTVSDLPDLPYTDYTIKETLRLYPATGILREALTTAELSRLTLKKGDIIWLLPHLIQRDPRYFDEPDRFWPARFAPDDSGQSLERRIPRFAYYPFGGGPRICIGNGFAMLEARLLLATIAQKYKLLLPTDYRVKVKFGATMGPDGPVPVQLCKRVGTPE